MCTNSELLKSYGGFLKNLAENRSSKVFTNGGGEFASILMGTMFDYTNNRVRIYCKGFRPALVMSEPYRSALRKFIDKSGTQLQVMVETDQYANDEPISMLKEKRRQRNDESIQVRMIRDEAKAILLNHLDSRNINFSVFDDDKYRLEYDPENFKALGSFNQPESAQRLAEIFDEAFLTAIEL